MLSGQRVIVRMGEADDAVAFSRFYRANDDFFARTQNRSLPEVLDPQQAAHILAFRSAEYEADRACHLLVFARESQELIGFANFTVVVRGYFQACYLGYGIGEQYEGQGLMKEALTLALGFAFGPFALHRVMANYMPENKRSGRLLSRLGFRIEGYAERYLKIHGEWRDHFTTALSAEDFRSSL